MKLSVKEGWQIIDTETAYGDTKILWARNGEVKITRIDGAWTFDALCAAYGQEL